MLQEKTILDEVYDYLGRFVSFPSEQAQSEATAWIAHTHLIEALYNTPRLILISAEPISGKSRLAEILEVLGQSAIKFDGASAAGFYSLLAVAKENKEPTPTMLWDEIDNVFEKKDLADIIAIINGGYRRGGKFLRGEYRHGKRGTEKIDTFCPVLLAGLDTGKINRAILSRSIVIRMKKRKKAEKVEPYRSRDHEQEGLALRDRLAAWGKRNLERAKDMRPKLPPGIEDRKADIWEPLLIVAACDERDGRAACDAPGGGRWVVKMEKAAVASLDDKEDIGLSEGNLILGDIRDIYNKRADETIKVHNNNISTADILTVAYRNKERPWGEVFYGQIYLDDRRLAKLLKPYGIEPKTVRVGPGPKDTAKGYNVKDFDDAWQRYLDPLPTPAIGVTSVTSVTPVTQPHPGVYAIRADGTEPLF